MSVWVVVASSILKEVNKSNDRVNQDNVCINLNLSRKKMIIHLKRRVIVSHQKEKEKLVRMIVCIHTQFIERERWRASKRNFKRFDSFAHSIIFCAHRRQPSDESKGVRRRRYFSIWKFGLIAEQRVERKNETKRQRYSLT